MNAVRTEGIEERGRASSRRAGPHRKWRIAALGVMAGMLGSAIGAAPDTLWVRRIDLGAEEYGNGVASRGDAIAVAGFVWATSQDLLVARLDQDGDTIWTRVYDSGGDEQATSACLDAQSNAVLVGLGYTYGGGPRAGLKRSPLPRLSRNTARNQQQQFALTAKYDSLGELKWMRTDTNHLAFGVAADSAGNYYVSGAYAVTDTSLDLWLAKLDSAGDTVWTRTFDFAPIEIGYRLALDPSGNIATCAYIGDFANFDCLTLKLTPDGDTIWTRRFDRGPDEAPCGVAVDAEANIVVAGRIAKDSAYDALVLKYDSAGTLLWPDILDFNSDDAAIGVACDSAGDIYVAGYTGDRYVYSALTLKLDSMGNMLWTATYDGSDGAYDVACDSIDNPIIAGNIRDSLSGSDLLVAKYSAFTGMAESHAIAPASVSTRTIITAAPDFVLSIPGSGRYEVRLCDLSGRTEKLLFSGYLNAGEHRFSLGGQAAGRYFVRVASPDGRVSSARLVLVK